MFETLLASARRRDRRPVPVMAAAGLHLLLLGTALTKAHPAPVRPPIVPDTTVFFLPVTIPASSAAGQPPIIPAAPAIPSIETAPLVTLPGLPAIDPGQQFAPPGPGSTPAVGVFGTPGQPSSVHPISSLVPRPEIDEAASVLLAGRLRYPPALEAAGLAGRVELEFVVDTVGRVEPGSLTVLSSSAPEFEGAARAAVLDTRFHPARARGHAVRQLVRQSIVFKVRGQ